MRRMIEERGGQESSVPLTILTLSPSSAHTFVSTRPRGDSERRRNRLTTHILIHLAVRRGLLDCRMAKLGCSTQTTGILNSRMCMLRVQRAGAALCKLRERERHAPVGREGRKVRRHSERAYKANATGRKWVEEVGIEAVRSARQSQRLWRDIYRGIFAGEALGPLPRQAASTCLIVIRSPGVRWEIDTGASTTAETGPDERSRCPDQ